MSTEAKPKKPRTPSLPRSLGEIDAKIEFHKGKIVEHTREIAYFESIRKTYFDFHPEVISPPAAPPKVEPGPATVADLHKPATAPEPMPADVAMPRPSHPKR